jgi:5-formyltetrahydrofolate cyclo-ligase
MTGYRQDTHRRFFDGIWSCYRWLRLFSAPWRAGRIRICAIATLIETFFSFFGAIGQHAGFAAAIPAWCIQESLCGLYGTGEILCPYFPKYSMMSTSKAGLRRLGKDRRTHLDPHERQEKNLRIQGLLQELIDGRDPVMVYVSKQAEADTHGLIRSLLEEGRHVIVPIIEQETKSLRLSYLRSLDHLSPSTFSVPEPIGMEIAADPETIAVVVVPMLAFDARGNRLGYGAGYYDRFFHRCPKALRIGVAFACQEFPAVPADSDDVQMDFIVTEDGIRDCHSFGDGGA